MDSKFTEALTECLKMYMTCVVTGLKIWMMLLLISIGLYLLMLICSA